MEQNHNPPPAAPIAAPAAPPAAPPAAAPAHTPPANSPPGPVRMFTRVSKACRRCRRLRTKCVNQGGNPPCESCRQAKHECSFPQRGESDSDRAYRHRRVRTPPVQGVGGPSPAARPASQQGVGDMNVDVVTGVPIDSPSAPSLPSQPSTSSPIPLGWEALPPYDEVVDGVQTLITSYFQLGFIPKSLFFEELRRDRNSVSIFLLLSILSVSARFTPCLVKRYQGGSNATRVFLQRATCLIQEQMFTPNLESIQGFFLMSIAEWGNGDKHRSLIYMGIAVRLAGILRMHKEETYRLPDTATREEIVHSEVARRTFWMLETFENLHSGSDSPTAFSYSDITVLLPCDEREFTFGIQPASRAALLGTPPAVENHSLTCLPSRSLFATLLQTHNYWGKVARLVSADVALTGSRTEQRINASDYTQLSQEIIDFEANVPVQHSWSIWNLRGFQVECLDLAYLSVVMVLRLSNIILRRSYLHDILSNRSQRDLINQQNRTDTWPAVADELFDNLLKLHEQITAFFEYRSPDRGYPALIVFCVYVCGSLANHLRLQPQVCPRVAPQANQILQQSIQGLNDLQNAWPLARRWYMALCRASEYSTLEPRPPIQASGDDMMSDTNSRAQSVATHLVEPAPEMDVQFNDPFPTDSMFQVFESYWWSELVNVDDAELTGEPLGISAWEPT